MEKEINFEDIDFENPNPKEIILDYIEVDGEKLELKNKENESIENRIASAISLAELCSILESIDSIEYSDGVNVPTQDLINLIKKLEVAIRGKVKIRTDLLKTDFTRNFGLRDAVLKLASELEKNLEILSDLKSGDKLLRKDGAVIEILRVDKDNKDGSKDSMTISIIPAKKEQRIRTKTVSFEEVESALQRGIVEKV